MLPRVVGSLRICPKRYDSLEYAFYVITTIGERAITLFESSCCFGVQVHHDSTTSNSANLIYSDNPCATCKGFATVNSAPV